MTATRVIEWPIRKILQALSLLGRHISGYRFERAWLMSTTSEGDRFVSTLFEESDSLLVPQMPTV